METASATRVSENYPGMYELSDSEVAAVSGGAFWKKLFGPLFKAGQWVGRKWHDHACSRC